MGVVCAKSNDDQLEVLSLPQPACGGYCLFGGVCRRRGWFFLSTRTLTNIDFANLVFNFYLVRYNLSYLTPKDGIEAWIFQMSGGGSSTGVGRTLAGGVQDVSAILPLIGTEQCEKHVGSALRGGYFYAAAAPLSIFGSLGTVKAGMTILVSSISITIPHISISFRDYKPSVKYSGQQKWFGGRMLRDAGFELTGDVASLIGMDGLRFSAESRLMEMLEQKHIDDPEKISIDWKSRQWNVMLVISTIFFAALSVTPYIALLLGPVSWRPSPIHMEWLFPILRIVGSSTAAIVCQFVMQTRVISLMKYRILFMTINQRLNAIHRDGIRAWAKDEKFQWDENLPAEQCIWSLEQYLSSGGRLTQLVEEVAKPQDQTVIKQDTTSLLKGRPDHISVPITSSPEDHLFNIRDLNQLQREQFPIPTRDVALTVLTWILLGLSLPATVAGYVGCFTLVGATPTLGNGPLVWVGLEAALSILRIVIWAANPSFDEETEVTVGLKLSEHQPLVTTDDYNPHITTLNHMKRKPFTLVPEREFLERITPFTGPLDQFQKADNVTLYFTLTTDYHSLGRADGTVHGDDQPLCLLMTLFDFNMEIGVTVMPMNQSFHYFDVLVKYNANVRRMEADILSEKMDAHPWRAQDDILFDSLIKYYTDLVASFNQKVTALTVRWDLSQKFGPESRGNNLRHMLPFLTAQDRLYLDRGYEHALKTDLVTRWSQWILMDMGHIRSHTRLDCHEAIRNPNSEKAKWEYTELDTQLVWGWASRELSLLNASLELEDSLCAKMETCASNVSRIRQDQQLRMWMTSEFKSGRRKRMEQERGAAKKRMERAMADASDQADREGRLWQDWTFTPRWSEAIDFIDRQWFAGINNHQEELASAEDRLHQVLHVYRWMEEGRKEFANFLKKRVSHEHWGPQHKLEQEMMKMAVERIRTLPADSTREEMDTAYRYPDPDGYATAKFATLPDSSSKGKACSALVYDAYYCGEEAVCNVVTKSTTRSVVRVDPKILPSILPNDHLLFLSCKDEAAEEPAFVQRNRDRWWDQQTGNSSMIYFTPLGGSADGASCYSNSGTIAHIFVFLTSPSAIQVTVLHQKDKSNPNITDVSIRENGLELGKISNVPQNFRLDDFESFALQPGRHELELVPEGDFYCIRDIFISSSDL